MDFFQFASYAEFFVTLSMDANGDVKLQNNGTAVTTWSFMKRKFDNVDIEKYPYIEIEIGDVSMGLASFKLSSTETPTSNTEEIA